MIYLTNLSSGMNLTIQPWLRSCECSGDVYPRLAGGDEPHIWNAHGERVDLWTAVAI